MYGKKPFSTNRSRPNNFHSKLENGALSNLYKDVLVMVAD